MAQFPNTTAADGIWTLKKVRRAILGDNWPSVEPDSALLTYTMSQSSLYSGPDAATYANMTDDNYFGNATGTNSEANAFVRCDLGSVQTVKQVKIAPATSSMSGGWNAEYTENRIVRYSSDGTNWTNAYTTPSSMSEGTLYTEEVDFQARYVEMYNASGYVALCEFQLWGY